MIGMFLNFFFGSTVTPDRLGKLKAGPLADPFRAPKPDYSTDVQHGVVRDKKPDCE